MAPFWTPPSVAARRANFRACDFGYILPNNLFNRLWNSLQEIDVHVMFFGAARRSQETIQSIRASNQRAGRVADRRYPDGHEYLNPHGVWEMDPVR